RARFRRAATRRIGASGRRFPSLFDGGRELSRAAKHVDARDGVLSDAGSTPAASTTFPQEIGEPSSDFPAVSKLSPRSVCTERHSECFILTRYSADRDAITSLTARNAMSIAASVCELPAASALAIEIRPNGWRPTTHARSSGVARDQSIGSNSV